MDPDDKNRYRPLLMADLPELLDRVDSPWDQVPTLESFNQAAYAHINMSLLRMKKTLSEKGTTQSKGIVVLGEAGTGKTHLLMRVAQNLSRQSHILFVPRPNNSDAVARHIWTEMVTSFGRPAPGQNSPRSQLEDMLAHVFSAVLIPEFQKDIDDGKEVDTRRGWMDKLKADPFNLFTMLGKGEQQRQKNLDLIRRRTLRFLQKHQPRVNQKIAHALITYCFLVDANRKQNLLQWLVGGETEGEQLEGLDLPADWVEVTASSDNEVVKNRKEQQAIEAIRTVGILSTYYHPLVLAFDQLEGLNNDKVLTEKFGDIVREISTQTPNMLMITCIFPRLWDSWFSKTFEQSVIDRVAQEILHLEPFGPKHGVSLLAIRMGPWFSKHHLPTNIYPFELHDANRFHEAGGSIRAFLRTANRSLQSWLIGTEIEPIVYEGPTVVTSGMLDDVLKSFMNRIEQEQREAHQSTIPIEHDLFGRVQNILRVLVKSCPESVDFGNAENGSRVMPSNVIISSWTLTPIRPFRSCIAVLNGSGNSFTACIGNLLEVFRGGIGFSTAILLRDARSKAPGAVGRERLTSFEQVNGVVIRLDRDELAVLNAIYETLVEIEEEGITVANTPVTTEQFVGYLRSSCVVVRSKLFQTLAQHFPPLHQVLYPPNASPGT